MEKSGKSIDLLTSENDQLKKELEEVKKQLINQKRETENFRYFLNERNKELHCHNALSNLFSRADLVNEELIQQILEIIPPSWQYPDLAEVKISLGEQVYQTTGYESSKLEMKELVVQKGAEIGEIVVAYPKGKFRTKKEAFLPEEFDLLKSIAGRISNFMNRKEQSRILIENEKFFQKLLDSSPDTLAVLNLKGEVLHYNSTGSHMFGYNPNQNYAGRSMFEFLDESDHTRAAKSVEDLLNTGKMDPTEFLGKKANGETFPVESKGELVMDENGLPYQIIYSIRDITGRKKLEEELVASERMLSNMIDNLPGMLYRCLNNRHWTMLFMSEGCYELTGYHADVFTGERQMPYNDVIHPEDRQYVAKKVAEGLKRSNSFEIEYRIIESEGTVKYVWEKGKGVIEGGKVSYIEGLIMEVKKIK